MRPCCMAASLMRTTAPLALSQASVHLGDLGGGEAVGIGLGRGTASETAAGVGIGGVELLRAPGRRDGAWRADRNRPGSRPPCRASRSCRGPCPYWRRATASSRLSWGRGGRAGGRVLHDRRRRRRRGGAWGPAAGRARQRTRSPGRWWTGSNRALRTSDWRGPARPSDRRRSRSANRDGRSPKAPGGRCGSPTRSSAATTHFAAAS